MRSEPVVGCGLQGALEGERGSGRHYTPGIELSHGPPGVHSVLGAGGSGSLPQGTPSLFVVKFLSGKTDGKRHVFVVNTPESRQGRDVPSVGTNDVPPEWGGVLSQVITNHNT